MPLSTLEAVQVGTELVSYFRARRFIRSASQEGVKLPKEIPQVNAAPHVDLITSKCQGVLRIYGRKSKRLAPRFKWCIASWQPPPINIWQFDISRSPAKQGMQHSHVCWVGTKYKRPL